MVQDSILDHQLPRTDVVCKYGELCNCILQLELAEVSLQVFWLVKTHVNCLKNDVFVLLGNGQGLHGDVVVIHLCLSKVVGAANVLNIWTAHVVVLQH